jgi:ElaB/YqjD/DUF883 family membrane-anchored ribosome-binding protein
MPNMSPMARDMANEAKGAARDADRAASTAAGDFQDDLVALRDDLAKLARQIADIAAERGGATLRKARSNVEGVLTQAQDQGLEAVDAVRELGENMIDVLDESIKKRPYTTLGLALGIGFLFGVAWRR